MRKRKILTEIFKIKEIEVTKDNINSFKPIDTIRNIRKTQVERLKTAFLNQDYLETTPVHANYKDGEFRVIDGNHRIVALRELFESGKVEKIKLVVSLYDDLNPEEEREVYDLIAKQVPQTTNDFLSLHRVEFPIWNIILKRSFPCKVTIYGSRDSIQVKTILYMLESKKKKKLIPVGYLSRDNLLNTGKKTTEEDYDFISSFIKIFMAAFGIPGTDNKFSKLHMIVPLFHIWITNKDIVYDDKSRYARELEWVKRFEMIMGDPEIVLYMNSICTRETIPDIRNRMLKLMQFRKPTKNKLI